MKCSRCGKEVPIHEIEYKLEEGYCKNCAKIKKQETADLIDKVLKRQWE